MNAHPSAAWRSLESHLTARDYSALALAVLDLPSAARPEVATTLRAYVRPHPDDPHRRIDEPGAAVIGAGVLDDVTAMTSWLSRYLVTAMFHDDDPQWPGGRYRQQSVVPQALFLLTRRGLPWLDELARRMADKLPRAAEWAPDRFQLVERLVAHTGQELPVADGFVTGWVAQHSPDAELAELFRSDRRVTTLLPRFFDLDEVGAAFDRDERWAPTLARIAQTEPATRELLLDACVARLGRPGKPGASRGYLAVHEALSPTAAEVDARHAAYLAMLGAKLSTIASTAQRELSRLDELGLLDDRTRLAATAAALQRSEKKIVRAQLAWVVRAANQDPARAAELAQQTAGELGSASPDLVRDAIRRIGEIAGLLDDVARRGVAQAGSGLPADLRAELLRAVGQENAAPPVSAATPRTAPPPAAPEPDPLTPIGDLDELATEARAVFDTWCVRLATPQLERLIDGLIRHASGDRGVLREVLRPVTDSDRFRCCFDDEPDDWYLSEFHLQHALLDLVVAATDDPRRLKLAPGERVGLQQVLIDRVVRTAAALRETAALAPVALPSWSTGVIEPDELVDRLARASRAGIESCEAELEQALLRVRIPMGDDERIRTARTLRGLGTFAGATAADWFAVGGRALPPVGTRVVPRMTSQWDGSRRHVRDEVWPVLHPGTDDAAPHRMWEQLTAADSGGRQTYDHATSPKCWPALAPHHRELIAAHCVPRIAADLDHVSHTSAVLPELARIDGRFGRATALALTYGLSTSRRDARGHAVDALVVLLARDAVDADVLATVFAELAGDRHVIVKRLVVPLREVADRGYDVQVWPVLAGFVQRVLARPELPGLADLLGLAAEVAERIRPARPIAGLDEFAARRGGARQLVEARRLRDLLMP